MLSWCRWAGWLTARTRNRDAALKQLHAINHLPPPHLAFIHHRTPLVYSLDSVVQAERTQIIDHVVVTRA
jgi:hypothetical protein